MKVKIIFNSVVTVKEIFRTGNNCLCEISFYCPEREEIITTTKILKPKTKWQKNHNKEEKFL